MLPITPHLANECLELMACQNAGNWPMIKKDIKEITKLAVQINGKTREIISIEKDIIEAEINKIVLNNHKTKKYVENKKIMKTIFVKNKIINYIIK